MKSVGARASALVPVLAGLILFALVGRTPADESNRTITFQARITQDGVPVTASLDLTFQIYTAQSGGAKLWEESHTGVSVQNGIMSVRLGDTSSLTNVFNVTAPADSDRWVAVRVGGSSGTEIVVPRIKLTSVPYSMSAAIATIASTLDDGTGTGLTLAGLDTRFGVAGGQGTSQTLVGGANAEGTLVLRGTSHVTSGHVVVQSDLKVEELALLKQRTSTPASVVSSYTAVYAKDDGNLYYKPSGGAEVLVGAGGGGAGGSVLAIERTPVSMGGTTETDLQTYTLPAGTLSADGETLEIHAWGDFGADAGNTTIKFHVGSTSLTVIFESGSNSVPWNTRVFVTRTGATTAKVYATNDGSHGSTDDYSSTSVSVTWANANVIKLTGQGTAGGSDAVTQELMVVKHLVVGAGGGGSSGSGTVLASHNDGRLTLSSTASVTTADTTSGVLYFLPHKGNQIALYNGSAWIYHSLSSISATTSNLTTGKNYDVFVYEDSGLKLQLDDWTDDTTRDTETDISQMNGVWSKTKDRALRYLGTVRTVTSGGVKFRDASQERFLWNVSNRMAYADVTTDSTFSWTDSGLGTWSAVNGGAAPWKHAFVTGLSGDLYEATSSVYCSVNYTTSIGLDSTSTVLSAATQASNGNNGQGTVTALARAFPSGGYHYFQGLETTATSGVKTAYGSPGAPGIISGMTVRGWH